MEHQSFWRLKFLRLKGVNSMAIDQSLMTKEEKILFDKINRFSWMFEKNKGFLTKEERDMFRGIGLSKSSLDKINKSVDHYFMDADAETPAMRLGTAFHTLVLEPDKFAKRYVIGPDADKRSAEGKKSWKDAENANPKKTILNISDWDMIHFMKESIDNHRRASELIDPKVGNTEETMMWNDRELQTLMKGRSDFRNNDQKVVIDLKSTVDATKDKIERDLWSNDFRYHVQAAIYTDGAREILEDENWDFYFIFAQKKPPYLVQVAHLGEKALEIGRIQYRDNILYLLDWIEKSKNKINEGVDVKEYEPILELHPPGWLVHKMKKQNKMVNDL